jgi:kynurenine formamidase
MSIYLDLTGPMNDGDPTMPMDPKLSISRHCGLNDLGYNLSRVVISTHQGTHMDAEKHFFDDGETIDEIPLERLIVRAVKVDLTAKRAKDPIDVDDLLPYEERIDAGCSVLLHTGWDKVFPASDFFSEFPYITKDLADWFADKDIGLIGMDMPTPNGEDWKYVHEKILSKRIIIVEGLTNMESLPTDRDFKFYTLPLKFSGRDGSPVRAFAEVD